ncbi:MAG: hypothetical protein J7M17_09055 [Anaerolineae bacterium]|nr:hypothetical protein [Anaerolineae bacterium]
MMSQGSTTDKKQLEYFQHFLQKLEHVSSSAMDDQETAMYIAMVVRNAMEDFHCQHLSDEQMTELNPLIRNAIYTALWALHEAAGTTEPNCFLARAFVTHTQLMIPEYWEPPELDFGKM